MSDEFFPATQIVAGHALTVDDITNAMTQALKMGHVQTAREYLPYFVQWNHCAHTWTTVLGLNAIKEDFRGHGEGYQYCEDCKETKPLDKPD